MHAESLLAIFPTGGGKSLTFQLPALMAGDACHGLTVVLSPLQSLMKDQVDHLVAAGISDAVTINGLLDPIERAQNFDQIYNGNASLLYVSPEQLRSRTLEKALLSRHIERFVIDEAHCFLPGDTISVWIISISETSFENYRRKKVAYVFRCHVLPQRPNKRSYKISETTSKRSLTLI